ncbi:hypothetical protein M422DRAFT_276093 [Sphaerobolus stellatus SS14]|uniref:Uncharacterized protein n=1 Tax=Sphaerobolus stellatus (strain SS14) TaxID=990650 RepID=A0A0C9UD32_SPHS4|nr:hypothetical protein M422DRAFT_276093 [Sphaerobolus stellatus SS14]
MDELVDVTRAASGSRAGMPLLNANASYTVHPFRAQYLASIADRGLLNQRS